VLLALTLLSGCVAPAPDGQAYEGKARSSVQSALSAVGTAQLGLRASLAGRMLQPYADRLITDSESSMTSAQAAFTAVQPPSPASDALQERTATLLASAAAGVTTARIAVRRADPRAMRAALDTLESVAHRLTVAAGELP
jgi:hypothetical protein